MPTCTCTVERQADYAAAVDHVCCAGGGLKPPVNARGELEEELVDDLMANGVDRRDEESKNYGDDGDEDTTRVHDSAVRWSVTQFQVRARFCDYISLSARYSGGYT